MTYHPSTLAYYAARLEAEQAEREFSAALAAFEAAGRRTYSPQDYAVWQSGAYADAAARLVRDMPVWQS